MLRKVEHEPTADNLAVRYGLRFGVATLVAGLAAGPMAAFALAPGGQGAQFCLLGCLPFLIALYLFGEVGHWTARRTGTISSGTLAAALAGLLTGAGLAVGNYAGRGITHQLPPASVPVAIAIGIVIGVVVDAATVAGFAAEVGAFGASIGRDQYRKRAQLRASGQSQE